MIFVGTFAAHQGLAQTPARKWTRLMLSASGAVANSSVEDPAEAHIGLSSSLAAGVRLNDFIGVGVESRRWIGESNEHKDFRLVTADLFPYYRAGAPAVRVTLGLGVAKIEAHPYAGGHARDVITGTSTAMMFGMAYDLRAGMFAFSPFLNLSAARKQGLALRHCSTPYYLMGNFTEVCSDGAAPSVSVMSAGLSAGIR